MVDTGERDDKRVAVVPGTPLATAADIDDLDALFPGVTDILRTWLSNYKGPARVQVEGIGNAATADHVLRQAIEAFDNNAAR